MSQLKIDSMKPKLKTKSALSGQSMVVVLMSALEESHRVVVILPWRACQAVFVFEKCLVSCNNCWCLPNITQCKIV